LILVWDRFDRLRKVACVCIPLLFSVAVLAMVCRWEVAQWAFFLVSLVWFFGSAGDLTISGLNGWMGRVMRKDHDWREGMIEVCTRCM